MGNAHKEVKKLAGMYLARHHSFCCKLLTKMLDLVTARNVDNGVALVLERMLKKL